MKHLFALTLMLCFSLLAVSLGASPLWTDTFEDGSTGAWKARGNDEKLSIATGGQSSGSALLVTGRTTTWQGPSRPLAADFKPGQRYRIIAWARYDKGPATRILNLSMELGFKDSSAAHQYKNLMGLNLKRGEWAKVEYEYTVPEDPSIASLDLYLESPYKADNLATADDTFDFLIDNVSVELLGASKAPQAQDDIPRLRDSLAGVLTLGAAVTPQQLVPTDPRFRLITRHFDVIVAENVMKPEAIQPREGAFSFSQADTLVSYAERTGTLVRGHTLVWHSQTPAWFFKDPKDASKPASKTLLLQRLRTHVSTVVGHYKGQIHTWDVVNEVLSDASGMRTGAEGSQWHAIAGTDYIDAAFRAARAADPDALLAINDYGLEGNASKREAMYQLVKGMKSRGVPVDVVGLQGHISIHGPSVEQFRQTIQRFASLGVKVQVTELDLSVYAGAGEAARNLDKDLLDRQARRYAELFAMFREESAAGRLDMVVLWGVDDEGTWLNNFPVAGRPDAPLLFDRNLQAKPAFWAVLDPAAWLKNNPVAVKTTPPAKQAKAVKGSPVVDGTIDAVWQKAEVVETSVATMGDGAAKGSFRLLWDKDTLYVLAEVRDPTLDDNSKNEYEQDSVEVFVDQNAKRSTTYESDDGQFRVSFRNLASFNGNPAAQKKFRSAARVVDGGYVVEMAIPFTEAGIKEGSLIGLELQVNDGTGGKRTGIRNFNDSSNNGWQSTEGYGSLLLAP